MIDTTEMIMIEMKEKDTRTTDPQDTKDKKNSKRKRFQFGRNSEKNRG